MMTRQMLLRGIARLVFISLFGLYCERINSFNQLGDCIYTRHEQQSHGTVNFASELGVEKDREGEKWIEKKKQNKTTGYLGFHSFVDRPPWEETAKMLVPLHQQKHKKKRKR